MLREEHRLRVFENRVLRRIFGPKRDEVTGDWSYLREIGLGGVDWIRLAQDRDQWRAVVSEVMNLRVLAPLS
jgi:hypothetical protein